jgi:hypothetical protein
MRPGDTASLEFWQAAAIVLMEDVQGLAGPYLEELERFERRVTEQDMELAMSVGQCYGALGTEDASLAEIMSSQAKRQADALVATRAALETEAGQSRTVKRLEEEAAVLLAKVYAHLNCVRVRELSVVQEREG